VLRSKLEVSDQRWVFYIGQKEVRFPAGDGSHGREMRASAMRNLMMREVDWKS
jgi:hypothetical protein